ncbi:penicillin-binding transpeptidase domain-containing protein [Pelosinus sp. IPA-1]|uniref:penicillin-binding protein n=1 Tax=Pelosinus sp. IPA-1 TaxID=3029569 RepID=UPI002436255C|nr:penicillin-binding transpeptidase domain-containing protein [Pelosinus sp. IPA-1]GMA99864.1 stage V sporulation protein D [Pelosinus sp. IPA-1]
MAEKNVVVLQRRMVIFLSVLLGMVLILLGRIGWLQFVNGERMTAKMAMQVKESKVLQSPRGTIYDRNGRELAISSLTKSLYADPSEIKDPDAIVSLLSTLLEMNPVDLREKLTTGGRFIWIKRMIEPVVAQKIQAVIKEADIKGLVFLEESKRYYPNDNLAAQVLGFVGTDDIGLDGMEMALDNVIKGKSTEHSVDTDSRGTPIFKSIFTFTPPKQGKNVYLTLDSAIQFIVEQSLDKAMIANKPRGATVIVMNPHTGEILAMANRPTYNPNQFYKYSDQEWKNRAVAYNYEPGSTFKSIVSAAALQEGKLTPEERFTDAGFVEVSGRRIQNWSGESYGNISFVTVIEQSINTCFVQIGMRLGAYKLTEYAKLFGFGKATGIELPGEEEGLLFDPKDMRDSDVATMSIGQSIAVTPLQLITAVSAIANEGVLLKPHIIKEIRNADGSIDQEVTTQTVRQAITPETARILTGLMEKVVSEGGGKKAFVKGYRFAGKTGTAEKLQDNGSGYSAGRYVASFVGFGPVEDPQVAVLVVLDDPQGVYYGGEIAAPIAGEILGQIMRHLAIYPQITYQVPSPKEPPQPVRDVSTEIKAPPGKVVVPNVTGKSIREAGDKITQIGLSIVPIGTGVAVRQSIAENTIVESGTEITIYFEPR